MTARRRNARPTGYLLAELGESVPARTLIAIVAEATEAAEQHV